MIPINRPFERVKDLAKKDAAGYTDPDEYNRHIRDVQNILMSYYIALMEETQDVPESLNPFITRALSVTNSGTATRPSDLRYFLEVYAGHPQQVDCKTMIAYYQATYAGSREVGRRQSSPIRKATLEKPVYHYEGSTIILLPSDITHTTIRYIRYPSEAIYAYTEDEEDDHIIFDAGNSVNLEWLPQDEHNIVDLLLFFKGLETRDTAIIQWVAGKKQLTS
jgi:hypothetical protein